MKKLYVTTAVLISIVFTFCFILPFFMSGVIEEVVFDYDQNGSRIFPPFSPSSNYWLGTDELGQDIFQQLVLYGKNTIFLVVLITFLRFCFALPLGYLAKKKKGFYYSTLEKCHHYLSALPVLFLVILFINLPIIEAASWRTILVVLFIVIMEVGRLAFVISNEVNSFHREAFYEASTMTGSSVLYKLRKYDLRHIGPTIAVLFMLELSKVMLLLGQIGFLSMFISQQWFTTDGGPIVIQNQFGTWASMLADSRDHLRNSFWIPLMPALAITITMVSFQLCAESLKRYFSKDVY
ncbi:ABC transporter permease subunit [Evansella cellulosilytica]|uniref:Binding-protein-dependent transport systems inner membrane component n=1 Tax=Evansella cellulosilytica (strain ATCC 21833 / DSM 2522 / FERM P-1141 / JCM 9156 / N-4) TaxID=649639 RepID=E6TW67_EVAC2|nr:ABC transporter permease subunit [Evansella cellulosilytica]ADU31023.1 binding-protein-dependent transport systems inner membrane component [Evansella cellulosilytica DSM 2522]